MNVKRGMWVMPMAFRDAFEELDKARDGHANMASMHEGYAVILEELDELWDEIKKRKPDRAKVRKEAIQVAAMALRFVEDLLPPPPIDEILVEEEPSDG